MNGNGVPLAVILNLVQDLLASMIPDLAPHPSKPVFMDAETSSA